MTKPYQRSRTLRRVFVKTPGGVTSLHYRKRKPSLPQCSMCGKPLAGVPRVRATQLRSFPKSQRRPERPYGGVLCSPCMRASLVQSLQEKFP